MKEIKPGYYSSMLEMVSELNAEIPAEPKTINLRLDRFDIHFDCDSFSNKSVVSHGVSIKMEVSNEHETPFMANMKRYTALYIYTDITYKCF